MKFYKVVNPKGHNGVQYKEGLNIDSLPWNPSGNCEPGGIYFSREDIFAFLHYGSEIWEVEPQGEIYRNPGTLKKWKAHSVKMKRIGEWKDPNVLQILLNDGANIHTRNDYALCYAAERGHIEVVKWLIKNGANIHAYNDDALCRAAEYGHHKVVKCLSQNGADIHAENDLALRWAAEYGHHKVVKLLIKNGANIHADNDYALRWALTNGHNDVVEYLKSI